MVWVRQEEVILNRENAPLEGASTEDRWLGSWWKYTLSETSFGYQERYVEHGTEWYQISLGASFDRPPLVLTPGTRYPVGVTTSHSGGGTGMEGIGLQFWYSLQGNYQNKYIEPYNTRVDAVLPYYPWGSAFDGTNSKSWMVIGPPATKLGDTFEMYASMWNSPCIVIWTYRVENH
jgi:hypothetical protein